MTAVSDAEEAVAEARSRVRDALVDPPVHAPTGGVGMFWLEATPLVDALIAAVRTLDAEIVRALPYEPGSDTIKDAWRDGQESAADAITNRIRPGEGAEAFPEVEVRFAGGPTVRVARFSVTTEAATGLIVVEGGLASWTGHPRSGDAVRIAYLGIPGRGALADITASVELFTRMGVTHIRIRTTIRPEEPTP